MGTLGHKLLSIINSSSVCVSSQECNVLETDTGCQKGQISRILEANMCFNYCSDYMGLLSFGDELH